MSKREVDVTEVGETHSVLAPARYCRTARIIREWQPHIVHGAIIEGYTLACVSRLLAKTPLVIMEETSAPTTRGWKAHLLTRTMAGIADHVIAVSPAVHDYLRGLGVSENKLSLIVNGARAPRPVAPQERSAVRSRLGFKDEDVVVGCVCRIDDAVKRLSDLILAVTLLAEEFPHLRLLVVGDGPDLRKLTQEVAASPVIADRVVFVGGKEDVAPFYAQMDVFALASATESFGLVLAEAMCCGLPVVATRVGGIPSVVEEGKTGVLVPPRSPHALADGIRLLLVDPDLRLKLGVAGRLRYRERFTEERYVAEVEELYERLLCESGLA